MTGGEAPGLRWGGGDAPKPLCPDCGPYILLNGLAINAEALDTGGGVMWGDCCLSKACLSLSATAAAAADKAEDDG